MNALEALKAIAAGERVADALLPPCRLEGMGVEAYGEEAIVHQFRQAPLGGWDDAQTVRSPGHAALFGDGAALVADLYGERILRIWRMSAGDPGEAEPAIGVAFDTDLFQSRRDIAMRAEDHPDFDARGLDAVAHIGRSIAHDWSAGGQPDWRTRPFLLRAFSQGDAGAALFAVHRLGPDTVRSAGFAFAAARFAIRDEADATVHLVRDRAGEAAVEQRPWRANFA